MVIENDWVAEAYLVLLGGVKAQPSPHFFEGQNATHDG